MEVEKIKSLAQQIKKGLLDSGNPESSVKHLLEALHNACIEFDANNENGKIQITLANMEVVNFFKSINQEALVAYVASEKGINLTKSVVKKVLELANNSSKTSEVTDSLELFLNELG